MAKRITVYTFESPENVEYIVQGKYPGPHGWEDLTAHATREAANQEMATYDANEPLYLHRVIARKKGNQP